VFRNCSVEYPAELVFVEVNPAAAEVAELDNSNLLTGLVVPIPTFCDASIVTAVVPAVCKAKIPVPSAVWTMAAGLVLAFMVDAIYFS
jgi:hypothetical protein